MSRRIAAVAIALVAAVTLSSCAGGTVGRNDVVASVGDAELTRDDLDEMLNNRVVQEVMQSNPVDGNVATMSQADNLISLWIALEAFQSSGVASLDGDATASSVLSTLPGDYRTQYDSASDRTQRLIARFTAFQGQLSGLDRNELVAAVQSADVHVDSRYGYWDPDRVSVIPFGTKLTPLATTTTTTA